ncbi:MAG: NADH-quinone oxidoreductase subunit N [Dehalococcoidia bacterium]
MFPADLYLLMPELALGGMAGIVIIADLVLKRKDLLAPLSLIGLAVPVALSIVLWLKLDSIEPHALSGFSDFFVVDYFSLFFKFLILGATALVIMASRESVTKFSRFQGEYYALIMMASGGMMLMAAATELVSIYVALELSALSTVALIALLKTSRSIEASMKFFILSAISSAVMLYGMALVFGLSGSTRLLDIAGRLTSLSELIEQPALLLGVIFIITGFGFKISSVPFQMWVPDVYEGSPTPVAAYLSVASKAAGFAVIIRVFFLAFGSLTDEWSLLFAVLAAVSMFVGNLVAIAQNNIKRMLGYSTIAHAGFIMVGLAAIGREGELLGPGAESILFYLVAYATTNLGAFLAVIAISQKINSELIQDYAGVARRNPFLAFALAVSLVSLMGIPPTAGFWAKLNVFNAAIETDLVWLALIGMINSVISAYFYLRVIKVMYLAPPSSDQRITADLPLKAALAIAVIGMLFIGIVPRFVMDVVETAVGTLA